MTKGEMFDYQLDRHCSKTDKYRRVAASGFDYQLDRHCSKTTLFVPSVSKSLITS